MGEGQGGSSDDDQVSGLGSQGCDLPLPEA